MDPRAFLYIYQGLNLLGRIYPENCSEFCSQIFNAWYDAFVIMYPQMSMLCLIPVYRFFWFYWLLHWHWLLMVSIHTKVIKKWYLKSQNVIFVENNKIILGGIISNIWLNNIWLGANCKQIWLVHCTMPVTYVWNSLETVLWKQQEEITLLNIDLTI